MRFKVGDKVKVLGYDSWPYQPREKIDHIGAVAKIDAELVEVKFSDGEHWWYSDYEVELLQDKGVKDQPKLYNGAEAIALAVAGKYLEPISGFGKPFYIYYDKKQKTLMNFNIDDAETEDCFDYIFAHQWKVISPPVKSPKFLIDDYVITNKHDIGKITQVYPHLTHVTYDVSFNGRTAVNYNEELLTLAL